MEYSITCENSKSGRSGGLAGYPRPLFIIIVVIDVSVRTVVYRLCLELLVQHLCSYFGPAVHAQYLN